MSTLERTTRPGEQTEAVLRTLVTVFSTAPLANGKRMRDLMTGNPEAFRMAAVNVLHSAAEPRGCRYLVTLLWTHDLLISTLADTSVPKELILGVARSAAKVDPQLHIRLSRFLVASMLEGQEMEEAAAGRLLEVLSAITDSVGVQSFLRQMVIHPNPRIRSKITLLVGRGQSGLKALEKLLCDEDARVRANAVEALWAVQEPRAITILRESIADTDNRVAGNAVIGLYLAGETQAIPCALALAEHESNTFRATGAWVMGQTKDPRFLRNLARLMANSTGQLRKSVFVALAAIKKAMAARADGAALKVTLLDCDEPDAGRARLRIAVTCSLSGDAVDVRPTGFVVAIGSELVNEYTCTEHRNDLLVVGFLLPRRSGMDDPLRVELEKALKGCLKNKRLPDQWALARYRETVHSVADVMPGTLMGQGLSESPKAGVSRSGTVNVTFSPNPVALSTAIDAAGSRFEHGLDLVQSLNGLSLADFPLRGSRHIVVIVDEATFSGEIPNEEITEAAKNNKICIHAICIHPNEPLESVCRGTGGIFRRIPGLPDLQAELALLYTSLRRQYQLEFEAASGSIANQAWSVQVNTAASTGEMKWGPSNEVQSLAAESPDA